MPVNSPTHLLAEWGVALPFFGGLLSGLIFGPLLETFKDYLVGRRTWLKQKAEIVMSLRFVMGQFHGFSGVCNSAYGTEARFFPEKVASLQRCVMNYDLSLLKERLVRLAEMAPRDTAASGVSQQLIAYLSTTLAAFIAVQKIEIDSAALEINLKFMRPSLITVTDIELLAIANSVFSELQSFLFNVYAPKMGIDPLSVAADREVFLFKLSFLDAEQSKSHERQPR